MACKRAYVSDFLEPDLRGTALGVFHTRIGIATLPASVIAGMLWEYDPSVTFVYGAAIGFLAAGLFVIARCASSPPYMALVFCRVFIMHDAQMDMEAKNGG